MRRTLKTHRNLGESYPSLLVRLCLIVVAGIALAVSACGSDEDARAKAAWIAGGDAICARVNSEIDALGEPKTLAEIAEYAAKVKKIAEGQLTELANLDPPKKDQIGRAHV